MTPTRIYLVEIKSTDTDEGSKRLVEAAHQAQALRHVTKDIATCDVATTKEVAELVAAGVKVEKA